MTGGMGSHTVVAGHETSELTDAWRRMRDDVSKRDGYQFPARFHDMRHTAITRLIAVGRPLPEVEMIAGRSPITTSMGYVHLAADYRDCITAVSRRRKIVGTKSAQRRKTA